jgi:hypothetical protein
MIEFSGQIRLSIVANKSDSDKKTSIFWKYPGKAI